MLKMIDAFTTCLASFTKRFESHNDHTQSSRDITPNAGVVWVKKVHMHKHYNMSMHKYFLCFVTLIGCVPFVIIPACVDNCVCLLFALNAFTFFLGQYFLTFMSKIQKHIKSRKSKKFD